MTFCVWCSLTLVLALPFGSGDSVTSGLSVNRPSADSENLDGLSTSPRGVTVTGPMFSGPGYPTPVAFSFKYMSVTNMLKRRVRHMTKALKPRMSWVKYTSMPGTSPPSSPAADLAQERWVGLGGTTPRLPPDDGLRSWGDHPPGPVASPLIPNGSGRWLVVPGTGNDEGVTCRDGSMAQHDLGGECSRAHSGFALGGVSGLRAVASGTFVWRDLEHKADNVERPSLERLGFFFGFLGFFLRPSWLCVGSRWIQEPVDRDQGGETAGLFSSYLLACRPPSTLARCAHIGVAIAKLGRSPRRCMARPLVQWSPVPRAGCAASTSGLPVAGSVHRSARSCTTAWCSSSLTSGKLF